MGMPLWLILIVVGIVLALIGFGGAGQLLVWLGVIILVVGVVMTLVSRSGTRV
jgi:membrane protein implicated in regulation of membrane protease activity